MSAHIDIDSMICCIFFMLFCRLLIFSFKLMFSKKHQSVEQFGSRLGLTFSSALSGSKLFAKLILADDMGRQRVKLDLRIACI